MASKPKINSPELWKQKFPELKVSDNKYTRGHLLINGSQADGSGATKLSAYAAARSGAGMVTVACDEQNLPVYAAMFMSIMPMAVKPNKDFFRYIEARRVRAVLLGPGNRPTHETAEKVLECLLNKDLKLVLDADAISAFEKNRETLISALHVNCILTPHEGEFRRVFEWAGEDIKDQGEPETNSFSCHGIERGDEIRLGSAERAAERSGAVIVLKGHNTVIASPDGRTVINRNAPATLATAGTGDVLAGMISGLFVQGMPAFEAACAGVYIHSKCADSLGRGLIAEDLIDAIPGVFESL